MNLEHRILSCNLSLRKNNNKKKPQQPLGEVFPKETTLK